VTFSEAVWQAAADTFGKKRGHANPLTPYTRTWRLVIERAEHALWVWNDKFGPLTPSQRQYATDLIVYSLKKAQEAPDCNAVYAHFITTLVSLINHERTDAGFERRREELPTGAGFDASAVLQDVAA